MGVINKIAAALSVAFVANATPASAIGFQDIDDYVSNLKERIVEAKKDAENDWSPNDSLGLDPVLPTLFVTNHKPLANGQIELTLQFGVNPMRPNPHRSPQSHDDHSFIDDRYEMDPDTSLAGEAFHGTILNIDEVPVQKVTLSPEAYHLLLKRTRDTDGKFSYIADKATGVESFIKNYEAGNVEQLYAPVLREMRKSLEWAERVGPILAEREGWVLDPSSM